MGTDLMFVDDARSSTNASVALPNKSSDHASTSGLLTSGKEAISETGSSSFRRRKNLPSKLDKSAEKMSHKDTKVRFVKIKNKNANFK